MREVTIELFHIRLDSDCGTRSILQTEWPCRGGLMWKCAASILLLRRGRSRSCCRRRLCMWMSWCVPVWVSVHTFLCWFCFLLLSHSLSHFIFTVRSVRSLSLRCVRMGVRARMCVCGVCERFHSCVCAIHVHMLTWMGIGALSFSWGKIDKYIWMSLSSLLLVLLLLLLSPPSGVRYGIVCTSFTSIYTVAVFGSVAATATAAVLCCWWLYAPSVTQQYTQTRTNKKCARAMVQSLYANVASLNCCLYLCLCNVSPCLPRSFFLCCFPAVCAFTYVCVFVCTCGFCFWS